MKAIKYIAQVLAAAALAFVAMWLLTRLMSWIFGWLLGLSNFWMLVVLFFGETVLIGIIISAASVLSLPFAWSNNENIIAVIVSALITLAQTILWIISVWHIPHHGFAPFITWLFVLSTVAFLGLGLIALEIKCYNGLDE